MEEDHINNKDKYINTKNIGNTTKEMKSIYILILVISYSYFIGVISTILFFGGFK